MAPSTDTSLELLQERRDLARDNYWDADLFVCSLVVMLGVTAAAQLTRFVLFSPDRVLIGTALLWSIAALAVWTIGMRYVDRLALEFFKREKAIDEYLNLPVS